MDTEQLVLSGLDLEDKHANVVPLKPHGLGLQAFQRWTHRQSRVVLSRSGHLDRDSLIFAQAVKLGEEMGELYAEVLGRTGLQRADKLATLTDDGLAEELADVLICAGVLAALIGVDLPSAVSRKVEKIERRNEVHDVAPLRKAAAGLKDPAHDG